MQILFWFVIYGFMIISFLFLPLVIGIIYKRTLNKKLKIKSFIIVFSVLLLQLIFLTIVYFRPIVIYSNNITNETILENENWAIETIEKPWKGFYSKNIPIIAYKFEIIELSDSHIVAIVHYIPFGKIEVQWNDGIYDILEPLM